MDDDSVAELESVGTLTEPVRRALYEFVARATEPVSRDAASEALGVGRSLAAFHLDRLVEARLLVATYRRLTGRTGPGAGRPSKLYERAPVDHAVTVPARRYDLAAHILADAIESAPRARDAVARAARSTGERIAAADGSRPTVIDVLSQHGFEPRAEADGRVVLGNCPFHALAQQHTELVCGANLALMEGVLEGTHDRYVASLEPGENRCCVVLRSKSEIA